MQGLDLKEDVDGYTWTYRVSNGGATIRSVAPKPSGDVSIPPILGGVPVKVIGASVFRECEGLTSVIIPDGVVHISNRAFYGCRGLASVKIPSSVTSIGRCAFYGCRGMMSVMMRGERPDVEDEAFARCNKLAAIHVPAKAKSWEGMKEWQGIPLVFDAETK